MIRRSRNPGPLQHYRLALLVILVAGIVSGTGAWLRVAEGAWHRPGLGYLLSAAALLIAAVGAVWRARIAGVLVVFRTRQVRLGAMLSLVGGIVIALSGCLLASRASGSQPGLQTIGEAVLTLGLGCGLAGFLSIVWAFGLDYLGERIGKLGEDDW